MRKTAPLLSFHSQVLSLTHNVLLALAFFLHNLPSMDSSTMTMTIPLIHRDSPASPLHNPSLSFSDRMRNAHRRALNHYNTNSSLFETQIGEVGRDYLIKLSIGTPPQEVFLVVDTGSEFSWTQCDAPCRQCYKQKLPIFQPNKSSTFKLVGCDSDVCVSNYSFCLDSKCYYHYRYVSGSYSDGRIAQDTFTFHSTDNNSASLSFPGIHFGCGDKNNVRTFTQQTGIVGLNRDSLSLVTQLNSTIGGFFSYCLSPQLNTDTSGKMSFGKNPHFDGSDAVVTTPMAHGRILSYYATLEAITVGNKKLQYQPSSRTESSWSGNKQLKNGNILIDSGTTYTFIPAEFYPQLEAAVKEHIKLEPDASDPDRYLKLCYKKNNITEIDVPPITFHFTGADLKLQPLNTFVKVADGIVCFLITPNTGLPDGLAIFGNLSQLNFLVGYDIVNRLISFKPTDCSKY